MMKDLISADVKVTCGNCGAEVTLYAEGVSLDDFHSDIQAELISAGWEYRKKGFECKTCYAKTLASVRDKGK